MKRLFLLLGLLLGLALSSFVAAKTGTLYFEFEMKVGYSSATIDYLFSDEVCGGILIEL